MDTLGQPTPVAEQRDNSRMIIVGAVAAVIALMLGIAFLLRQPPKKVAPPSPYIAQLKLSDFKMSAAENFIGHTVSYVDGTITNTGDKTVARVMVEVTFLDSIGQLAQREELPLRVVRTNGAYNEPVDLNLAPLGPGQSGTAAQYDRDTQPCGTGRAIRVCPLAGGARGDRGAQPFQ